jgi:CHASE3 domain sensor protein
VNWTVSRRIIAGFAMGAALVLLIAIVGIWALRDTAGDYADAIAVEREVLLAAVNARGGVRNANIAYLRSLVDATGEYRAEWEAASNSGRQLMAQLRDDPRVGTPREWTEAIRLLDEWQLATSEVMALWQAGDTEQALAIRSARVQPAREQLEEMIAGAIGLAQEQTDAALRDAQGTADNSERGILIGLLLSLIVFILTAYLLNRAVSVPLQDTSNVLATSAAQILATTTEQATGATESLAAVTQTAATVDEVV